MSIRQQAVSVAQLPNLDPNAGILPEQVAAAVRTAIETGLFRQGDRLPSSPAIARRYGLAVGTVATALRRLESDGVVRAVQGIGTFVRVRGGS